MLVKDSARTIVFALILGIVCSATLAVASMYTAPFRKSNEEAEKVKNFLSVLDVSVDDKADSKILLETFEKNVRVSESGGITLYENISDSSTGKPSVVAVPFAGAGLWAPIEGVISFEPDLMTIRGISFYKQEETPGLGGEIGSEWFQEQFKGKKIISESGEPGFMIIKPGGEADINSVDGISGATMTSDRVQEILDDLVKKVWEERNNYVQ
jgi:Na+-transporting NADH:ubiquinone oxidoreductase subunit C